MMRSDCTSESSRPFDPRSASGEADSLVIDRGFAKCPGGPRDRTTRIGRTCRTSGWDSIQAPGKDLLGFSAVSTDPRLNLSAVITGFFRLLRGLFEGQTHRLNVGTDSSSLG